MNLRMGCCAIFVLFLTVLISLPVHFTYCAIFVFLAILIGLPVHFTYNRPKVASVKGQCAVIMGASTGIGITIAENLAAEGVAQIVLAARSASKLEKVAEGIRKKYAGVKVLVVPTDVAKDDDRRNLKSKVKATFGSCGILVNNAGVESLGRFHQATVENIDSQLDINLKGLIHLTHLFLPDMVAANKGHVVNIASFAGKTAFAMQHVYAASKFGVVGFTNALRAEMILTDTAVTFHAICPGYITDAGMAADALTQVAPDEYAHTLTLFGSCTPMDSAKAVVDAIEYDEPEIIVNSIPLRPLVILTSMFPRFPSWIPIDDKVKSFFLKIAAARA